MGTSECWRYHPSRAEDHRGGFVLHDHAARRMCDFRDSEQLDSRAGAEQDTSKYSGAAAVTLHS